MVEDMTIPEQILSFVPANPFSDLTGARPTSTIAVVIFAAFLGIAYLGVKRKRAWSKGKCLRKLLTLYMQS